MALSHAKPGEVISVRPLGGELAAARTSTLLKTDRLELIRLVVHAGKQIPTHSVAGELIVQCLEGNIRFTAGETVHPLHAGDLLVLPGGTPHAVEAVESSSLLLTIRLPAGEPTS